MAAQAGFEERYIWCIPDICCFENHKIVVYYALAKCCVSRQDAPGNIRRRMPEPIPVIILGRLAVDDHHWQGTGIGAGLLKDAVARSLLVAQHVEVRALLVHALDDKAKGFTQPMDLKSRLLIQ